MFLAALLFLFESIGIGTTLQKIESPKAAEALVPLRVAYSAITVNQAIPWITYEAGLFKKHGLDVQFIHASSITALHALLAGGCRLRSQSRTRA